MKKGAHKCTICQMGSAPWRKTKSSEKLENTRWKDSGSSWTSLIREIITDKVMFEQSHERSIELNRLI